MYSKRNVKRLVKSARVSKNYRDYKNKAAYYERKYQKVNHLYKHFKTQFGPGHFYSPYPDLNDIESRKDVIFDRSKKLINGIDIREPNQLKLLKKIAKYYPDLPYGIKPSKQLRYYLDHHAYAHTDAIVLFCMLRHLKPKRIIEVGSGYSSALMLDYKQLFDKQLNLTFVEPYPKLLKSLIKPRDKYTLIDKPLHQTEAAVFDQLESGDFLFIDSTHVAKPGSDVNEIYFKILPALKKGVIIHIHDIFYPFEYPHDWYKETRAWNEDYIVRAFLYNNPDYQIEFFNHFLNLHHKDKLHHLMPATTKNDGGSLWIKKVTA